MRDEQRWSAIDLTERELQIVGLLAQQYSSQEISETLLISLATVRHHVGNIFRKLREPEVTRQDLPTGIRVFSEFDNYKVPIGVLHIEAAFADSFDSPDKLISVLSYDVSQVLKKEVTNKVTHIETEPHTERVFADDRAREGWEISRAVERIAETLPAEGQRLDAQPITFDEEYRHKGLHAIFTAGTVIGTGRKGVLVVPDRTLQILDVLKIPYTISDEPQQ